MNSAEKKDKARRRREHRARVMMYRRRRIALLEKLGAKCDLCPETDISKLQFDHLNPREWVARKVCRWTRIKLYEREAEQGLIRILCGHCNKLKGKPDEKTEDAGKAGSVLSGVEVCT